MSRTICQQLGTSFPDPLGWDPLRQLAYQTFIYPDCAQAKVRFVCNVPTKSKDLHGNAPDQCEAALLLIDVINDLEFKESELLIPQVMPMARKIHALKRKAAECGVPVIYVNDNFGKWQSDFHKQVEHCLGDGVPGKSMVELLRPGPEDYFVLKPKHSGFFSTTLDTLLTYLGAKNLILTGIAGDRCVLFTANDAYLRDFNLFVPADCVVSNRRPENQQALKLMQRVLNANISPSGKINLRKLCR